DFVPAPRHLLEVEAVRENVLAFLVVELEALRDRPAIFLLPEPRDEDRDVIAYPSLCVLPPLVKLPSDAVRRALEDDLRPRQIRNGLNDAREVRGCVGPERHF